MASEYIKLAETNNNFRMKPLGIYFTAEPWFGETTGRGCTMVYAKGLLAPDGTIVYDAEDRDAGGVQQIPRLAGTTFNNFINETLGEFLLAQGVSSTIVNGLPAAIRNLTFAEQITRKMNSYAVTQFQNAVLEDKP